MGMFIHFLITVSFVLCFCDNLLCVETLSEIEAMRSPAFAVEAN